MGITSILLKGAKYTKRALNLAPEALLGDSTHVMGKAVKATKGSIFTKAKAGIKAFEKEVETKKATQGGFLKRLWHNTTHFVQDVFYKEPKAGVERALRNPRAIVKLAQKKGVAPKTLAKKAAVKGALKGFGKGIMKKIPFIGQVLNIVLAVPNIYNAAKDEGLGTALKEAAWEAAELGGFAGGAALGTFICPGLGTIIGGVVGSIAVSLLRGPSYSEKKDSLIEEYGLSEEEIKNAQQQGYTVDDIYKEFKKQEEDFFKPDSQKTDDNTKEQGASPVSQAQPQQSPQQSAEEVTQGQTQTQTQNQAAQDEVQQREQQTVQTQQQQDFNNLLYQQNQLISYANPFATNYYSNNYDLGFGTLGMYNGTLNTGFGGYGYTYPAFDYGAYNPLGTVGFTPYYNGGFAMQAYPQYYSGLGSMDYNPYKYNYFV